MTNLSFEWFGQGSLEAALRLPIAQVSIEALPIGTPSSITLWHPDGSGIEIYSVMHNLSDTEEVGVLTLKEVHSSSYSGTIFRLPVGFTEILAVKKLAIEAEVDFVAESGIVIEAKNGCEFIVVAGSFPCSLAIRGVPSMSDSFTSEWPLEKYTRVNLLG